MPENNLFDLSINDILRGEDQKKYCFIVPSYQRGYRWGKPELEKLLDDLYEFYTLKTVKNNPSIGDYYCMQPITFKRISEDQVSSYLGENMTPDRIFLEVVDGQQRLTTVFLILKFIYRYPDRLFIVEYARDLKCDFSRRSFLSQLKREAKCEDLEPRTVDEHFFKDAFFTIKNWFADKWCEDSAVDSHMETTLLDNTKFIMYEIDDRKDCYEVFKNLNKGKIPLTDAELVKAMLLNSKHFLIDKADEKANAKAVKQQQDYYARLWDEMQKSLNYDDLWAFLSGNGEIDCSNHIDLLLLIDIALKKKQVLSNSDHKIFSVYEEELRNSKDAETYVKNVFDDIRKIYRAIQNWNEDSTTYNFIGYRMSFPKKNDVISKIISLLSDYMAKDHDEFISSQKDAIASEFKGLDLDSLNYIDTPDKIVKILMLFNILELNSIHKKFDFDKKGSEWSIEHIKAQHSQIVEDKMPDLRRKYLAEEKERILLLADKNNFQKILFELDALLAKPTLEISVEEFISISKRIDKEVDGFQEENMHQIGNLALLLQSDNSSFGNDPFYKKRERLFEWLEYEDKNIPHSTVKAFMKMYSPQEYGSNYIKWDINDFSAMRNRQFNLLKEYMVNANE